MRGRRRSHPNLPVVRLAGSSEKWEGSVQVDAEAARAATDACTIANRLINSISASPERHRIVAETAGSQERLF